MILITPMNLKEDRIYSCYGMGFVLFLALSILLSYNGTEKGGEQDGKNGIIAVGC